MTDALGGEFGVLLKATHDEIAKAAGERIAMGIEKSPYGRSCH